MLPGERRAILPEIPAVPAPAPVPAPVPATPAAAIDAEAPK
jgi:hypothetical protein